MRTLQVNELTHLRREAAVQRYFDGVNYARSRWLLAVGTPGAVIGGLAFGLNGLWPRAAGWIGVLAIAIAIFFTRRRAFFVDNARHVLLALLATVVVAVVFSFPEPEPAYIFAGFLFPLLVLAFRLRPHESAGLLLLDAALAAWFALRPEMSDSVATRTVLVALVSLVGMATLYAAATLSRRAETAFRHAWEDEVSREREQTRMRSELHSARDMQLSMLPQGSPQLPWLDFSAVSLPASEVGGDYYDHFELDEERVAIVIGDVAGHGMASGLVLSGLRGGLYLLRDRLAQPVEVLRRLNEMLRVTAPKRMFVTFQIAVLDRANRRLTVASAGHPPLLHLSNGQVEAVGGSHLPLGTGLDTEFVGETRELAEGDCLLLYTDGVVELTNYHELPLGEEQLARELQRAAAAGSARQVRDSLLNGLSRYKGDVEQEDDLTLVVLRLEGGLHRASRVPARE